jgi:hypothetical protein
MKKFPAFFKEKEANFGVRKRLPFASVLSQINPVKPPGLLQKIVVVTTL